MLVAIVSVMNNETCLFGTRSSDDLVYQRKTSIFSLSAGVTNIHPGYYVYQIGPYEISEEKLRGRVTHTETPQTMDYGTTVYVRSESLYDFCCCSFVQFKGWPED